MDSKVSLEPLSSLTTSMWKYRALVAAVKLGLFQAAEESDSASGISRRIDAREDPTRRILGAMVSMGLMEKEGGSYSNSPLSREFLLKDSPNYYGDFILMTEGSDHSWKGLDRVIRSGEPVEGSGDRFSSEGFTRAMHNNAQAPARMLSESLDLSGKGHVLDIGGGSGAFSIILTNKHKGMKATVLELPEVCKTARKYIEEQGDPERVSCLEGDFFATEFPEHDVAIFGQILHSNSPEENMSLLKKVFESISQGGLVIATEFLMNEERTGPVFPAMFGLNMLIQTRGGNAYTFSEVESWMKAAGFGNVRKMPLVGPHTAIIAEKE